MRKKTHEEYKAQLYEKNPNLKLMSMYEGNHKKVDVTCIVCGYEFASDAASLLQGHGCPKCGISIMKQKQSRSHSDFIDKMKHKQPNLEVLSQYTNSTTKVEVVCKLCGNKYFALPSNLLKGYGCKQCYLNSVGRNIDEFKAEVAKKNCNIIVGDDYVSGKHKVTFTCKLCGYSRKVIGNLFLSKGCRCPKCDGNVSMSHDEFVQKIKQLNDNIKINSTFGKMSEKVSCLCEICGYSWNSISYSLIRREARCPRCEHERISELKRNKGREKFLSQAIEAKTTIEFMSEYKTSKDIIKCRCADCGHEWDSTPDIIKANGFRCPKCQIVFSKLESALMSLLEGNGLNYELHKSFGSLKGVNGRCLSYDFYLPENNLLIECQGLQHERPVEYFGGEETFKIQREHDKRKREYAREHNIDLLEIWYWDFDNIEQILKDKLHN